MYTAESKDISKTEILNCLTSPASITVKTLDRFPQKCGPRTFEAAECLRLSVHRTSEMYLWHWGFWRNTFPLFIHKLTLFSPQISFFSSSHLHVCRPSSIHNLPSPTCGRHTASHSRKRMDTWTRCFSCRALREACPAPSKCSWDEACHLVDVSASSEFHCVPDTAEKWTHSIRHP